MRDPKRSRLFFLCIAAASACSACSSARHNAAPSSDASLPDAAPPTDFDASVAPPSAGRGANRPTGGKGSMRGPGGSVQFPLRLSDNRRYLVDQNGQPFLINQASSWGLIQSLSTQDATAYLDDLRARGFNTVMVSIISYDIRMAGDPPDWQGVSPFRVQWDFSTPNETYFAHADQILELAKERGMLVDLVPCYLGFVGDATEGWEDELQSANNSLAKSRAYGEFLGKRYKDSSNIVWVAGGDNLPPLGSLLEAHLKAVVDGIRAYDHDHLWTAHWNSGPTGTMATDDPTFASYMDLNGYYAFNYDLTYEKDLTYYNMTDPVRPVFHLDMSYETEMGGTPENIRRKAYTAMLSGAAGSSFNAGPDWYLFFHWDRMDSEGTRETTYWYQLFASRPWYELVPDGDHRLVTAGYGRYGDVDYVCAARSSDGELGMAYLPNGQEVSVDLSALTGARANVWWYDPTSGQARSGGTYACDHVAQFKPPSADSWLLVIDDAALGLPAPGMAP